MLAMAIAAMSFTSCEDVPAPYPTPEPSGDGVYINQTFANTLNPWVSYLAEGTPEGMHWTNAFSSAVCTGSYADTEGGRRANHAGKSWLVGPTIDLSKAEKVRLSFDHAIAYERTAEIFNHHVLMYSTDYVQGNSPSTAVWTRIDFDYGKADHSGGNYNFEQTGANLTPEMFVENITFAFVYESTTQNASTWEIKNFLVMEGEYTAPVVDDGGSEFKKTTGIISGQTYAIGAQEQQPAYEVANALTGNYGYMQKETFMIEEDPNVITVSDKAKFTITKVDDGYTIQDAEGKYYYMKGTYNSFNRSEGMSDAEGSYIWNISFNENGEASIVNKDKQKTIMFDGQFSSYGAYAEGANSRHLPYLFTNGEVGGESDEPGEQPGGGESGGETGGHGTTQSDPLTVAEAIAIINDLADNATTSTEYFIKGKTTAEGSTFYFNATYGQCNYYISADGSDSNAIYVYNGMGLNNEKFAAAPSDWGKGSEVVIKGKLQKYVKSGSTTVTPEIARGNYVVSVTAATPGTGGGETGGGSTESNVTKSIDGTTVTLTLNDMEVSNESITCTLNDYGWENAAVPTTVTLSDGTTIVFSKGEGGSDPKYYTASNGVRMYAKNDITITGYQQIAKVVLECDSYGEVNYVGNEQLYGNVSDKVFKIINDWTGTSGGTQLRVKTITIYYAGK